MPAGNSGFGIEWQDGITINYLQIQVAVRAGQATLEL